MQCSLGKPGLAFLAAAFLAGTAGAETPLEALKAASLLPPLDLAKLKKGEIVVERGPVGDFSRGVHLQSCYFIRAPMSVVGDAFLHWNPREHRDLDVHLYREFTLPGSRDDFKTLRLDPGLPDDKWLLEQTARVAQGAAPDALHLTTEEAVLLRQKAPDAAWQELLLDRSNALARGGLAALAPYRTGQGISPDSEFRGLLTLAPKAAQHFQPVLAASPLAANGKPANETVAYWEAARVRDHTTLQLGFFVAQKKADSWQLVDCVYYPSDTYYMALDLFQLWPVEGGTLVWQVGFVSAPFRSYLGGVDRFVAGKLMTEQTLETIKAFRADVERRR